MFGIIVHWHAPFAIVIFQHQRIFSDPWASFFVTSCIKSSLLGHRRKYGQFKEPQQQPKSSPHFHL